ncbi:flagellar basal body-associated FliL family protein [Alkalicella caledoniensis]|uniref:Flagellar protein FliL n=1 Tax=Alkalicella caledoniensis TaxID=2731377 RepID=A0A7G9WCL4_ALKCA|nr:flagellar basal body-associated FliL family protein [Alkalicella caledoniensis]QNO16426.1 flagellar basal body-associated FliL family protein [Alkalicella caledoniensis]
MEKEYTLFNLSFLIIVGVILIVLSAAISFIIATRVVAPKEVNVDNDKEIVEFTGKTVQLGAFTTDLRDTNRNRIIRVEISVEVDDNKAIAQIEERYIQLQDQILSILRSKTADELKGEEGKKALSEELKVGIEQFLSHKVVNIYFKEFIVQ